MAHYNRPTSSMSASGGGTGSHNIFAASGGGTTREKTYFEQQREALIGDIAMSFEHVLANINKLNRSLEAVIAVGNEFSSVEALWSQFENVMAKEPEDAAGSSPQNPQQIKAEDAEQHDDDDDEHAHEADGRRGRGRSGSRHGE
ncbi:DASH complex subunit Dad1-domain-containing protein [Microdochium trichocladiopsis]|uniref:DASH complex subunit DAD1 n=1 Tax=Microdochium trichocladiopsis TaxID=1682393 RepID=A0A9P9BVN5_9PEZI|nr:DASH complex subunit Dad1-domain-containing protein [Microdochium trichocladiopsis]KAH7039927.1 DASH complex subunit Dad1-domain-containing protein [Microdochium trichocladiopsis]